MKSLKARLVIFMFLCVAFISCEKEGLNSDPEDLNNPPEIVEFLLSPQPPLDLSVHDPWIQIWVIAVDKDSDEITYFWECSQGRLEHKVGEEDYYRILYVESMGIYTVRCAVSDGKSVTVDSVLIEVVDGGIVLPDSNLNYTEHIFLLFSVKCGSESGCHSPNFGGLPARGLDLTNYQNMITHLIDGSELLIIPFQGEESFLYNILLGPISSRPRMPKDRAPLTVNNIVGIRTWINEGAPQFSE